MYTFMDQDTAMKKALRIEHQEAREEGRQEGREEGREEGRLQTLSDLVKEGILTLAEAAKRAGLPVSDFKTRTTGM